MLVRERFCRYYATGKTHKVNMFQAINEGIMGILSQNKRSVLIGEDVEFGGVFRCSTDLKPKFGKARVFNTPLTEQGIVGFALGLCSVGYKVVAEIQFADYIYPAFDQIVNEVAKYRYRSGGHFSLGSLIIRAPAGAVGHGGIYHSQSPESLFSHCPGLKVVFPSNAYDAKGLMIACSKQNDPVIFFEPKRLYRSTSAEIPVLDYEVPIGKARVVREGTDVTIIGWGPQTDENLKVASILSEQGISSEVIDLITILPYDIETIIESVKKTGRAVVAHEAPRTSGFGAELAASISERALLSLKAPILRCTGFDTPFPLVYESYYLANTHRIVASIKSLVRF